MTMAVRVPGEKARDGRRTRLRVGVGAGGVVVGCAMAYLAILTLWLPGIPDDQDTYKDYSQIAQADWSLVGTASLALVASGVTALMGMVSIRRAATDNAPAVVLLLLGLVAGAACLVAIVLSLSITFSNGWD